MTLAEKKRQLKELGLPDMTPQEERDFQLDLTDTAAVDARMSEIGSTRTTVKGGARVTNGRYKGLTPAQAAQAAMTGVMPKGKFQPGAMGRMSGSLTGDSLPQRPRLTPPPVPSSAPAAAVKPSVPVAPTRPVDPALIEPRGFSAGPVSTSPSPQASPSSAAPAIARAYTDNKNMGITARDANGVQFDSGARIMPGANGSKSLVSPYGSGSVQFLPPGQKASDPRLAAEIAAIKDRQSQGIYNPTAPMVPPIASRAAPAPVSQSPAQPIPNMPAAKAATAAPAPGTSANEWTSPAFGPPKAQRMDGINAGPPVALRMPGAMPDVMNPNWRRAQIAAAQPAAAGPPPPLPPYSETLASLAAPKPAAAPAPAGGLTKPPMIAPPATAAPSPGGLAAAQMGSFAQTLGKIGGALNASDPNAWINDPLGMKKKPAVPSLSASPSRPLSQSSAPSRPAKSLQPPQIVMSR